MGYQIGPKLRRYREARKLTQKEFATLIGVSNSRVSNWEQGLNRPDVDKFAKICEILKVSPSELLDINIPSENNPMYEHVVSDLDINDEVKQLAKQYSLLSDKDRELVKNMINSLSEKVEGQQPNDDGNNPIQ